MEQPPTEQPPMDQELPKEPPLPDCNVKELAFEFKKFIDSKKIDLINPGSPDVQCYPPPDDEEDYPETKRFTFQMKAFFDFVDEALANSSSDEALAKIGEEGEWSKPFDNVLAQVAELVNQDQEFWKRIRGEVIPLYKPGKVSNTKEQGLLILPSDEKSEWDDRWQKIKVWFDPEPLPVTVVKKMVNSDTKEVVTSELYEDKEYPCGLVIDIF